MAQNNNVRFRKLARKWGAQPTMLDVLENNQMHMNLFGQHTDELAMLEQGRSQLRAETRNTIQGVKDQRRLDLASTASAANERGVLGSSMDVQGREDVRNAARLGINQARTDRAQGLLGNWAQVMQSRRTYEMGVLGLQQQQAAARAAGNANNVVEDFIKSLNQDKGYGGGGGGGGNNGGGGQNAAIRDRIGNKSEQIRALLATLDPSLLNTIPGAEQVIGTKEDLWQAFRKRNRLRGRLDLDPIAAKRLRARIARALGTGGYQPDNDTKNQLQ